MERLGSGYPRRLLYRTTWPRSLSLLCALGAGLPAYASPAFSPHAFMFGNGLHFEPRLKTLQIYDTNLLRSASNPADGWLTLWQPGLVVEARPQGNAYRAELLIDSAEHRDEAYRADDYRDVNLLLSSNWQHSQRYAFGVDYSYSYQHQDRGTGLSDGIGELLDEPDEYQENQLTGRLDLGASYAPLRLVLESSLSEQIWQNRRDFTRLRDHRDAGVSADLRYQLLPQKEIFLRSGWVDSDYLHNEEQAELGSDEIRALVGLGWDASALTEGELAVGVAQRRFDDKEVGDSQQLIWDASLIFRPNSYSSLQLASSRQYLAPQRQPNWILASDVKIGWRYDWQRSRYLDWQLAYTRAEYENDARSDGTLLIAPTLGYELWRWLDLGATYQLELRDASGEGTDYDRQRMSVYARISF